MSKSYKRGRALEYKAMKHLREAGCSFVTRSAGSHSAADLVAVKDEIVLFIQVKAEGAVAKKDRDQLIQLRSVLPECCKVAIFEAQPRFGWRIHRFDKYSITTFRARVSELFSSL